MAKIADSYSEYIEALNTELSMGKELKTDSIYDAFCKFVSNKQLLKQIIENGGFRFEYIQFINLMRDTLWEDCINLIIELYRNAKQKDHLKAIAWLNECIQDFTDAGEKWTQKARSAYEPHVEGQRPDIDLSNMMEYIGGVIEGAIKSYIRFVRGCIFIENGKDIKNLKLGVMVQNLIDKFEIFKAVYCDMLAGEKLSDWRNVANHEKYSLQADDNVELIFGTEENERKKFFSMQIIWFIAKQIDVLAYMNKIAVEMIKIDEIENIGDSLHAKRKNIFKQRDDQIAAITELAVNSGMRLINIDFEQNIVILIEIELKKELLADFLYKMKFIFKEINMEIIIKKGNKVHYTTKLLDETGKIMVSIA